MDIGDVDIGDMELLAESGIESGIKKISIRIEDSKKRQESNGNSKRCTRGINKHMLRNGSKITEH